MLMGGSPVNSGCHCLSAVGLSKLPYYSRFLEERERVEKGKIRKDGKGEGRVKGIGTYKPFLDQALIPYLFLK